MSLREVLIGFLSAFIVIEIIEKYKMYQWYIDVMNIIKEFGSW